MLQPNSRNIIPRTEDKLRQNQHFTSDKIEDIDEINDITFGENGLSLNDNEEWSFPVDDPIGQLRSQYNKFSGQTKACLSLTRDRDNRSYNPVKNTGKSYKNINKSTNSYDPNKQLLVQPPGKIISGCFHLVPENGDDALIPTELNNNNTTTIENEELSKRRNSLKEREKKKNDENELFDEAYPEISKRISYIKPLTNNKRHGSISSVTAALSTDPVIEKFLGQKILIPYSASVYPKLTKKHIKQIISYGDKWTSDPWEEELIKNEDKTKLTMSSHDLDAILRIQLLQCSSNPDLQKTNGRWNFKHLLKGSKQEKNISTNRQRHDFQQTNNKLNQIENEENEENEIINKEKKDLEQQCIVESDAESDNTQSDNNGENSKLFKKRFGKLSYVTVRQPRALLGNSVKRSKEVPDVKDTILDVVLNHSDESLKSEKRLVFRMIEETYDILLQLQAMNTELQTIPATHLNTVRRLKQARDKLLGNLYELLTLRILSRDKGFVGLKDVLMGTTQKQEIVDRLLSEAAEDTTSSTYNRITILKRDTPLSIILECSLKVLRILLSYNKGRRVIQRAFTVLPCSCTSSILQIIFGSDIISTLCDELTLVVSSQLLDDEICFIFRRQLNKQCTYVGNMKESIGELLLHAYSPLFLNNLGNNTFNEGGGNGNGNNNVDNTSNIQTYYLEDRESLFNFKPRLLTQLIDKASAQTQSVRERDTLSTLTSFLVTLVVSILRIYAIINLEHPTHSPMAIEWFHLILLHLVRAHPLKRLEILLNTSLGCVLLRVILRISLELRTKTNEETPKIIRPWCQTNVRLLSVSIYEWCLTREDQEDSHNPTAYDPAHFLYMIGCIGSCDETDYKLYATIFHDTYRSLSAKGLVTNYALELIEGTPYRALFVPPL